MTSEATNPDDIPNGAGNGETDSDAPDTASGGSPSQPSGPPKTEEPDGTPVENPAG